MTSPLRHGIPSMTSFVLEWRPSRWERQTTALVIYRDSLLHAKLADNRDAGVRDRQDVN